MQPDSATLDRKPTLLEVLIKATVVHTATYFVMGLGALYLFDYATEFSTGALADLMRDTSDPLVAAGILFQPIRGLIFGLCFFAIGDVVFKSRRGWLIMWLLLVSLGIVSTFGPSPGSIEGMIYTNLPLSAHIGLGLIEVGGQALLLSLGLYFWVRQPTNKWLGWGFGVIAGLAILASLAGIFLAPGAV